MAKKITQPAADTHQTSASQGKATEQDGPVSSTVEGLQPRIIDLLRIFHRYRALYIDSCGGVFTEDTPESIRGNATLYDNPFHKQ